MSDSSQPSGVHAWNRTRGGVSGQSEIKRARLRKIYVIAAIMLILTGAIAGLFVFLRDSPRPMLVVLRIDQYRDVRLPISPWASEDREGLRQLGLPENSTFTSQERELLKQALRHLGREQPKDQPLLIYLCAFAAVQDDGTVALLPADAKLDEATTWLPIKEVLAALQECPVKHRLLLLDLAQPCVEPRAGLLAANVPERLKPALEAAAKDDPNLQILSACAPGQSSLASEELGHTVFAHYVIQGLAGKADGFLTKKQDQRVTVRELVEYVTMQVDRWAYANTGLRQTPEFFGNVATDYELTGTDGKQPPPLAPLPREVPKFLFDGWTERDNWWKNRLVPTPPEQLTRLERMLLRAEERWRKGDDAAKVESDWKAALGRLQREHNESIGSSARPEPLSLAEVIERGQRPPEGVIDDTLRKLKSLGNLWAAVKQPKPNEKPSEMDVAALPKKMEEFVKPYQEKPFDLAWTIFAAALNDTDLQPQQLRCWLELPSGDGKPLPRYEEIRFLKRLADLPIAKADEWPPAASDALQLIDWVQKAEALNPKTQAWLVTEYADARKRREQAEKSLFSPTPAERLQAGPLIQAALQAYKDLFQHLKMLRDARRTHSEAQVFLPSYPAYLEHDPSRLDVWLDAVQNTQALHALLSKTPDADQVQAVLRQVDDKASTLRTGLNKLLDPLNAPLARGPISDSRPPRVADAMEMRALLRLPGLPAPQRKIIWTNARDLAAKLNDETVQREGTTDTLPPADDARAVRQESNRAQMRAQISQGLLRLAGSADVEKVDAARQRVARTPLEEPAWEALRKELRQAWKRQDAAANNP